MGESIIIIVLDVIKQNITLIISFSSIILATITFVVTQSRMKKSEQIKIVHDIQDSYFKAFDKYSESFSKDLKSESIDYLNLLSILDWYSFLRSKNQINKEFDTIFDTYFRAAHIPYNKFKDDIKPEDYIHLKIKWKKLKL